MSFSEDVIDLPRSRQLSHSSLRLIRAVPAFQHIAFAARQAVIEFDFIRQRWLCNQLIWQGILSLRSLGQLFDPQVDFVP